VGVRASGRVDAELPTTEVGTGPWAVSLVVRSGNVERKLTGEVTFPRRPGQSNESTSGDGSVSVLAVIVALFALGAVGAGVVLYRRGQIVTIDASTPSD
jgi:hypothetical protein